MALAMSKCEAMAGTRCRTSPVAANEAGAIAKVTYGRLRQRHRARTMHKASPIARFLACAHPQTDEIAPILFGQALYSYAVVDGRLIKKLVLREIERILAIAGRG